MLEFGARDRNIMNYYRAKSVKICKADNIEITLSFKRLKAL